MGTYQLNTPIQEKDIKKLKVGDIAYVTGNLITARDAAHNRIFQYLKVGRKLPLTFEGSPLYHCGPLVKKENDEWKVLAAGPTTSMRMEPFEHVMIRQLGIRFIIGKGGMGPNTVKTMKEVGAVYGVFTGGAAVLAAKRIVKVANTVWLDLGIPDAIWILEVIRFGPLIIGIDAHGNSLFDDVKSQAEKNRDILIESFLI